jgi:hypothetical protein
MRDENYSSRHHAVGGSTGSLFPGSSGNEPRGRQGAVRSPPKAFRNPAETHLLYSRTPCGPTPKYEVDTRKGKLAHTPTGEIRSMTAGFQFAGDEFETIFRKSSTAIFPDPARFCGSVKPRPGISHSFRHLPPERKVWGIFQYRCLGRRGDHGAGLHASGSAGRIVPVH